MGQLRLRASPGTLRRFSGAGAEQQVLGSDSDGRGDDHVEDDRSGNDEVDVGEEDGEHPLHPLHRLGCRG